jgi:plasmid stability protein
MAASAAPANRLARRAGFARQRRPHYRVHYRLMVLLEGNMTDLLIPDVEDDVRDSLRRRAERNGHSMEEEVRDILRAAAAATQEAPASIPLGTRISNRFAGWGLTEDLAELPPQPLRPLEFDE